MGSSYGRAPREYVISGLDYIEIIGSMSRYVTYTERTRGGVIVRRNEVNFVMPNMSLPDAIAKAMKVPTEAQPPEIWRVMATWRH